MKVLCYKVIATLFSFPFGVEERPHCSGVCEEESNCEKRKSLRGEEVGRRGGRGIVIVRVRIVHVYV